MPTSSAAVTSALAPAPLAPNGPMLPKMIPNFTGGNLTGSERRGRRGLVEELGPLPRRGAVQGVALRHVGPAVDQRGDGVDAAGGRGVMQGCAPAAPLDAEAEV